MAAPSHVDTIHFCGFNPEGFHTPDARDSVLVLSDDDAVEIAGQECKRLPNEGAKRFRRARIPLETRP